MLIGIFSGIRTDDEENENSVLNHIRICIPGIMVTNIITDYEAVLTNALMNEFPRARLRKCWIHMAQVR